MFRKLIPAALVFLLSACQAGIFAPTATPSATPPPTLTPTPEAIVIPAPLLPQDPASLPLSEAGDLVYYDQTVRTDAARFNQNNPGFTLLTPAGQPDLALKEYIEPKSGAVVGTRIDSEALKKYLVLGTSLAKTVCIAASLMENKFFSAPISRLSLINMEDQFFRWFRQTALGLPRFFKMAAATYTLA